MAIVVGALFGKGAQDAAKEIKAAADGNMMYTPALESVDSRGQRDQTLEFTFIGLGAAALAGGIVCYILSNGSESPSAAPGPHVSFHPSVGPNAGAAALRVSF